MKTTTAITIEYLRENLSAIQPWLRAPMRAPSSIYDRWYQHCEHLLWELEAHTYHGSQQPLPKASTTAPFRNSSEALQELFFDKNDTHDLRKRGISHL